MSRSSSSVQVAVWRLRSAGYRTVPLASDLVDVTAAAAAIAAHLGERGPGILIDSKWRQVHTLLGLKNDARYLFVSCPSIVVRFGLKAGPPHVCVLPTDASLAEVITMLGAVSPHAIPSVDDTVVLSVSTPDRQHACMIQSLEELRDGDDVSVHIRHYTEVTVREGSGGDPEDVLITVDMNFLGFLASVKLALQMHPAVPIVVQRASSGEAVTEASFLTLESGEQLTVLPHGTPLRSSPLDSLATEVRQLGFSEDQIARGLPLASSLEQFLEWCATDETTTPARARAASPVDLTREEGEEEEVCVEVVTPERRAMYEQVLEFAGCTPTQAWAALARTSSVPAAVEWILQNPDLAAKRKRK